MVKSMTAFCRKQFQHPLGIISWEVRSLNGRYLDVYFHLPEAFRELEVTCREIARKYLQRGKVDCTLYYQAAAVVHEDVEIDKVWLNKLYVVSEQVKEIFGENVTVNFTDLLRWPGMMKIVQEDISELNQVVLELFDQVLLAVDEQRILEGSKLSQFIGQRLVDVQREVERVRAQLTSVLDLYRKRIFDRFEELNLELDKTRLEQEMVFVMQRMDISEELDRLGAHVTEVERSLKTGNAVGRRLDFLMQELHREANTLGSKSMSDVVSHASVEIKVLVEQMREQIQNIE